MLSNCEKCQKETPFIIPENVCSSCTNVETAQDLLDEKELNEMEATTRNCLDRMGFDYAETRQHIQGGHVEGDKKTIMVMWTGGPSTYVVGEAIKPIMNGVNFFCHRIEPKRTTNRGFSYKKQTVIKAQDLNL